MISASTRRAYRPALETLAKVSALLELTESDQALELTECEFCRLPVATSYHESLRDLVDRSGLQSISTSLTGPTRTESGFVAGLAGSATICRDCSPRAERFRFGNFRPLNPDLPVLAVSSSSSDSRLEFRDLETAGKYCRDNKVAKRRRSKVAKVSSSSSRPAPKTVRAADARKIATVALEILGLEMPAPDSVSDLLERLELERRAAEIVKAETGTADPYAGENFRGSDLR